MTSKNKNFGISDLQFFIKECKSAGILDNNKIATLAVATKKWDVDFVYAFLNIESNVNNADSVDNTDKELEESATSDSKPLKEKSGVVNPESAESAQNANIAVDTGVKELPSETISPISMVMHHIVLWFFLFSVFPLVIMVFNKIFYNSNSDILYDISITPMVLFIVVVVLLGGLYGALFSLYIKKLKKEPYLRTGKIFSLIVMAVSLITVIASLITIVVSNIVHFMYVADNFYSHDNSYPFAVVLSSLSFIIIYGCIFMAYYATDFMSVYTKNNSSSGANNESSVDIVSAKRIAIAKTAIISLFAYLGILVIAAFFAMPGLNNDAKLVKDIENYASAVHDFAEANSRLPLGSEVYTLGATVNNDDIVYRALNNYQYELCAEFRNVNYPEIMTLEYKIGQDDRYTYIYEKPERAHDLNGDFGCYRFYNENLLDIDQPIARPLPVQPLMEDFEPLSKD